VGFTRSERATTACRPRLAQANCQSLLDNCNREKRLLSCALTIPALFAGALWACPAAAQDSAATPPPAEAPLAAPKTIDLPDQGYPDLLETTMSVEGDIDETAAEGQRGSLLRRETLLGGYFEWKQRLRERTGFSFSGSWGLLYQHYSETLLADQDAVGSKFTLNMSLQLANRGKPNALSFDVAVEDRRPLFTDRAPLQAGLLNGSGIPTAATWGEFDLGITQAYIHQNLADNRYQYTIGKIFAPNFVDAYPFFDDNRQFLSLAFSTSPTIAVPLRGFGFVGAAYPTSGSLYVKAGMFTAHSDDTGFTVDDFFTKSEHFYFFEVGSTTVGGSPGVPIFARGPMDRNNFHITTWYRDPMEGGVPRAYGIAGNANFMVNDRLMWFLRGGWSDGWVADTAMSTGIGWRPAGAPSDLLGVAAGWAHPSNRALNTQYVIEAFYRFHVTPHLAFTPDIQFIANPTLHPTADNMVVFSFRGRIAF